MSTSFNLLAAGSLVVALALTAAPQVAHGAQASKPTATATPAPTKSRTPQQQRMADCSHQAKLDGKKGAERKAFMSTCLKGKKAGQTAKSTPPAKPKIKTTTSTNLR